MAQPGRGHLGYLQFGREATWGTAVAATHRVPYVSCDTKPVGGTVDSEMNAGTRWLFGIYQGPVYYETTLVVELWYEGMLHFLDALMGTLTYGSNGGTTAGSNPYTHTINGGFYLNSYTNEIIEGQIESTKCQRLVGSKITSCEISGSSGIGSGSVVRLTLNLLSKSYQTDQTPTVGPSLITALPVMFHELVVTDGSGDSAADVVTKSFTLSINNRLAVRQWASLFILEPVPEAHAEIILRLTKELHTSTALDAFNNFTSGQPSLVFGTSSSKRITISTPGTANLVSYSHPIPGSGMIMQEMEWKEFRPNNAAGPLRIVVENTQATITT